MSTRTFTFQVVAQPGWVPSPGYRANVNLNALSSVNPCPTNTCWYSEASKQSGPWVNWNGAVFAPNASALGGMVFFGGGHGGYDGTEGYLFDLSTRLWSRLGNPVPTDFLMSLDATWCDYLYAGNYTPPAPHTYAHCVYQPPSLGGGVKGSYYLAYEVFGGGSSFNGVVGGFKPHRLDISTGQWSRAANTTATPYLPSGPYGGGFLDSNRGIAWINAGHGTNVWGRIDFNQSPPALTVVNAAYGGGYYENFCFVPSQDIAVVSYCNYGQTTINLLGLDMSSGTPVAFTITHSGAPTNSISGHGIDYCSDNGKFYLYNGQGAISCYTLTPPTNWRTGTWTWGTESFQGAAPVSGGVQQGNQPFSKWKYNPAIKCFMWSEGTVSGVCVDGATRDGAFQLWRPMGT